jgi:hypothetical protein
LKSSSEAGGEIRLRAHSRQPSTSKAAIHFELGMRQRAFNVKSANFGLNVSRELLNAGETQIPPDQAV